MQWTHVEGKDRGKVRLYALSTCGWCAKTKQLLMELGVDFRYVYVDLLDADEMAQAIDEVAQLTSQQAFPTIVIDDDRVIVGYRADQIREALGP
ncbi:MAG: glutaredoxin family protein [Methanomicrobiales archaeon]|nr:glutaredoxin family protein [Methanomicrobiales archaeon]MDI6875809.1 glutaredoxin family protein [Methanomicrobiales archaeon]